MSWADLNLMPTLPEIFLLSAVSVILVLDLFLSDKQRGITYLLSLLSLIGCAVITLTTSQPFPELTFSGMFVDDPMADLAKVGMYVAMGATLVYSRQYIADRGFYRGEFFTLSLFMLLGMMVMVSAHHFLTLYIGLELMSLALYALVALRRDSTQATEAAMKYFVLGALASGMLLYGMSMVYGATGSLDIGKIAAALTNGSANMSLAMFGLVFIVAGLAFKLGAVPFHMWVPDVYQGAPTAVTLLIGGAPKLAAFVFVVRILSQGLEPLVSQWQGMLVILAVLSMAIGNITAIAQTNLKRMLAYSTISHMGFLVLGILAGTPAGLSASLFYAVVYVLMSLAGFGVLLLLSRAGVDCETLDDLKGLNRKNSWYAFLMLVVMFSMAGIPPMVGFNAKLAVLKSVVDIGLIWLAVVGVVFSLIGAFYYLRVVKVMYFDEATDAEPVSQVGMDMRVLLSVNAIALLVLGIVPDGLYSVCVEAMKQSLQVL